MNSYAESAGGFNSNHGQTSRPAEPQKQQSLSSTWSYNGQLDGMYYSNEHQPMFVGPYDGTSKHPNYPQYPSGALHQPVPTPVVKCHEACCQHFQDRYPLNPAPLRYQPSGLVQPRFGDLPNTDSRQYFTDRRSMPSLSRKKVYAENGYPSTADRRIPQYVGRGQLHLESRQQMQMMRAQYPMYPPYWGSTRGWTGSRMNCPPPPPYHQSLSQGAQLKMTDSSHYIDATAQKSLSTQHRRAIGTSGGTDIIRSVPDPKRSAIDTNSQGCYEFGYPTGFVPFSEVNKIQGGSLTSQGPNASCKIPNDKQYHPHQMQYAMQSGDRSLMNCGNPINELSYPMNFPMPGNDSFMRSGLEDGQSIAESRKMQYDSLSKKRPDLDLRQYLSTWEDDEDESSRIPEALSIGNNGTPYIVVDCRSLEGEAAAKLQERLKTTESSSSKPRSSSPNSEQKQANEQIRRNEASDQTEGSTDYQNQTIYAPSMQTLLNDNDKSIWNNPNRDDGAMGKGGAFQPLDCSKRDSNQETKRDTHPHGDLAVHKLSGTNDNSNMTLDALVSYYGDNRRVVDGGYDFVEMTERLVNNSDKTSLNTRSLMDHALPSEMPRPCDPRLQQPQLGNNPSIYSKVSSRYPTTNYQNYKPSMHPDPYYNYKHPISSNKYFGYDNSQIVDPNYEYHKIAAEFDSSRIYGSGKDISKDARRMFHQDIEKNVESSLYDPNRKTQLADCFQEKSNLEFSSVDPEQFINSVALKKSLDPREKLYPDKNHAIRDQIDALNTNLSQTEKTVLITSQNGPPEIFRVPLSPDKEMSNKDNVVTLHAGDQSKISTMTVEVPYVQQYSTLVKLSEEISRAEKDEENNTNVGALSNKNSDGDEFKKPTSFKLKRVPNSKEWTVEGKEPRGLTSTMNSPKGESTAPTSTSSEIEARDSKQTEAVSSLNMPSLDDIRDGEESQSTSEEQLSKNRPNDGGLSTSKICSSSDETNKAKHNLQTPQMAIVQPMKIIQSNNKPSDDSFESQNNILDSASDKAIGKEDASKEIQFSTDSDISKHGNFRAHKKIQSGFSNTLPSCIVSSNDDFIHSQNVSTTESKETYSPFHAFSECDVNSQLSDYFKIDDRNPGGKILDSSSRVPSSPGVDAMFEDINNSNQNQIYPTKSCNFDDIADPNSSLTNHNAHFQSFSSIFSEEGEKLGRPDGSVLQMNDKKYLKNIFDDIGQHEQGDKLLEISILNEVNSTKSLETKKSPPIPTISLKLNETKKMWCIANKVESSLSDDAIGGIGDASPKSTIDHSADGITAETVSGLENDLVLALHEESTMSFSKTYKPLDVPSTLLDLNDNEQNSCCESQNESDLNKLICDEIDKHNADSLSNILEIDYKRHYPLALEETSYQEKENLNQLQNANKCRSLVKYCSKSKVLKQMSLKRADKYKTLIFDQHGNHFTQQSFEAPNQDIAYIHDLIHNLIINAINICEHKDRVANTLIHFNGKDNGLHINKDTESGNANNGSVIKFDSSGYQNKSFIIQSSVLAMTKSFIQNEQENEENSVIKVTQSESFDGQKIIRSIFSPESENGDQEEHAKNKDVEQSHIMESDVKDDQHFSLNNKHALDLSYKRKLTTSGTCELLPNGPISQHLVPIACSNGIIKEGSAQFYSSKVNVLPSQSCHKNDKDNHEIDEALELMGLATSKSIEDSKYPENIGQSLSEDLVDESVVLLNNPLDNEDGIKYSQSTPRIFNNIIKESRKTETFFETANKLQTTIIEKISDNVCSQPLTHKSLITGSEDNLSLTKYDESHIFKESDTNNSNFDMGAKPETCLIVRIVQEKTELEVTNELLSQEHEKRKFDDENTAVDEAPVKKMIKTVNLETQNNNCDQEALNANTPVLLSSRNNETLRGPFDQTDAGSHLSEDVESRLETSVIVRNESCSNQNCTDKISNSLTNQIKMGKSGNLLLNKLKPKNQNPSSVEDSFPVQVEHIEGNQESANTTSPTNPSSCSKTAEISNYFNISKDSTNVIKNISDITPSDTSNLPSDFNCLSHDNTTKPTGDVVISSFKKQQESVAPSYCSRDSLIVCIDDANSYLEINKQIYFFEYKIRKWQRYSKLSQAPIVTENCHLVKSAFSTKIDYDPKPSDANPSVISLVPDVLLTTNNLKNDVELTANENTIGIECQETLKDVSSLTPKGKQSFCVRRDSLKILEPEAVLKEIFSPDSVSNDSESKENECPTEKRSQNKHYNDLEIEPLSHINHTLSCEYNSEIVGNKLKDALVLLKSSNNDTCRPFDETDPGSNTECNEKESCSIEPLEKGATAFDPNIVRNPDVPVSAESLSCNDCKSENFDCKSNIQNANEEVTSATHQTKSQLPKTVNHGPQSNCSNNACTSPTSSTIHDSNNMAFYTSISTNNLKSPDCHRSILASQQSVTACNLTPSHDLHDINLGLPLLDASDKNGDTSPKEYTGLNKENKIKEVLTNHDVVGTIDQNIIKSVFMDKTTSKENIEQICGPRDLHNIMSLDSSLLSEKEKETSPSPSPSHSCINDTPNENSPIHCTVLKCDAFNVSNDSDLTADRNEGLRTLDSSTVDELHQQMRIGNESYAEFNSKIDVRVKDLMSEKCKEANNQNIKMNSFQDALIHNHDLNKENPLQCLVEAALALENVESRILNNNVEGISKNELLNDVNNIPKHNNKDKSYKQNILTPADKEIFSKFEETNYNLRASTRIVTSSSSNIIAYPKRKYTYKSSKISIEIPENKANISNQSRMEKCRSKKRKSGFTYPRSKRRKKVTKIQTGDQVKEASCGDIVKNEFSKYAVSLSNTSHNSEAVKRINHREDHCKESLEKARDVDSDSKLCSTNFDNGFGGPLIIANSHNSSDESNVLCAPVSSSKTDQYVNDINVEDLEDMAGNQSLFKESSVVSVDTSHQTLENSTSLVIIFENLNDQNSTEEHLEERIKEKPDFLGAIDSSGSVPYLPQSDAILDNCAELLTTEFLVNESCVCPPGLMKENSERLKETKQYESIDCETLMSKSTNDVEDNFGKFSESGNQELLTASCYEELNDNLVNDIGNWPFVEEEVAEFRDKNELPNEIPEEGRKIELKCSLPWKRIFNISRKRKSKESKKMSGLELGPAKVEVRLRAPSSEWKVISDFYDNASPVVKVKRLILQRDTDLSSLSEKDSEEENEQKRKVYANNSVGCALNPSEVNVVDHKGTVANEVITNATVNEHWQPVVLLKRIENLDEINLLLEKEQSPQCNSSLITSVQSSLSSDENSNTSHSHSEHEGSVETSVYSHHYKGLITASNQPEMSTTVHNIGNNIKNDNSENETPAKFKAYETYSPSNCSNNFTSEKLYSPSDPHFSPDTIFKDIESNSPYESMSDDYFDKEDEYNNQITHEYLCGPVSPVQKEPVVDLHTELDSLVEANSCNQEKGLESSSEQENFEESNYTEEKKAEVSSDLLQKRNERVVVPDHDDELEKCSPTSHALESPKAPKCSSPEIEIPNNIHSESIINLETEETSPKKVVDEPADYTNGKRELPRKMPKNFFVRRRIKKKNHSKCPHNNSQLVEGNFGLPERPFSFPSNYGSMPDPLYYENNQRGHPSSQTSTESQNEKSSGSNEHQSNSESDATLLGDSSRLQSAYDLEVPPPVVHNESPLVDKFEVKQRLRDSGRGIKRPSEGHSKEDTKRRRKRIKKSTRCHECNIRFETKEELARHSACWHTRRRELHHCLLCQRSFSSAVRHGLHLQGRSHRHLELTQRHTMHAMHHLLVGGEFPLIPPLSRAELRALQWRPAQPGYAHFYHQLTPLQAALQEHNTDVSEDTMSEDAK